MNNSLKLNDGVLARFVQLVQLAIFTGIDVADYLRQIELEPDPANPGYLKTTTTYDSLFDNTLKTLQDRLVQLEVQREENGENGIVDG